MLLSVVRYNELKDVDHCRPCDGDQSKQFQLMNIECMELNSCSNVPTVNVVFYSTTLCFI